MKPITYYDIYVFYDVMMCFMIHYDVMMCLSYLRIWVAGVGLGAVLAVDIDFAVAVVVGAFPSEAFAFVVVEEAEGAAPAAFDLKIIL